MDSCFKQLSDVPITFLFNFINKNFFCQEVEGGSGGVKHIVPAEVRLDGGDDRERRDIEQNTESLQKDGSK